VKRKHVMLPLGLLLALYIIWGMQQPPILQAVSPPVCTPSPCATAP
jgi:hypothetical protein